MGSSGSKLAEDELQNLSNTTRFTKKVLKATYKTFMKACPSGNMTPYDMIYLNRDPDSWGIPDDFYFIYFKAFLTKDDSKVITFKEYVAGLDQASNGTEEEKTKWNFKVYDQNTTGKLTYDDTLVVQKAFDKLNAVVNPPDELKVEPRCKRFFTVLDKDPAVDTIDYDEFIEVCKLSPLIKIVEF